METFGGCFTAAVPAENRSAFLDEVEEMLRPSLFHRDRGWTADYMLLRFTATKLP